MEARPNPINLVLLLKSRATPLSLAKNKMECFNSKMVEAKLLERQVTYWNESIGGLVLINPENQRGRADLLTYN